MTAWASVRERIVRRIDMAAGGCWNWTGAVDDHGYGRISFRGRNCRAPRVAWCAFGEAEWPVGMFALHSCDNRLCVNPAHIRPGTNAENIKEMWDRGGRQKPTHCRRGGHEFTPENTVYYPSVKGRRCRKCDRQKGEISNQRRKERATEMHR